MSLYNKFAKIICTALVCSPIFAVTNASAENLPCVQRLIDWNNISPSYHWVNYTAVTLHAPSNIASYTSGSQLQNSYCRTPSNNNETISSINGSPCLYSAEPATTLISSQTSYVDKDGISLKQPFDVWNPIYLTVDSIPVNNFLTVQMHQAHGSYAFTASCAGDLLIGNDQYGNHWTMAFSLEENTLR